MVESSILTNSPISHFKALAISIRLSRLGCEVFVTHLDIVAVSLFNISLKSLLETIRSAMTTLILFKGFVSMLPLIIFIYVTKIHIFAEKISDLDAVFFNLMQNN